MFLACRGTNNGTPLSGHVSMGEAPSPAPPNPLGRVQKACFYAPGVTYTVVAKAEENSPSRTPCMHATCTDTACSDGPAMHRDRVGRVAEFRGWRFDMPSGYAAASSSDGAKS